ncbi:hypothetical protein JKP88DRAFT_354560 [Tribonema minus]|uniref:Nischarin n=1 Tax=Tribonema minus TaxID=303371 RepID=A0A835YZK0_9STRA|nr:hypothetical protein JKP88DRAFT_354560 [Tribonema minus]
MRLVASPKAVQMHYIDRLVSMATAFAFGANVYMEDIEFLSQLLEYMDKQQAKAGAEGRHDWSTAPLIILSTVVAAQAQVYLADFFQRAGGEGLYAAAAAEARAEPPPLGQLAHDNSRQRQVVPYQWSMLEVLRVESTEGLDRLFSLQVLDLGHNLLVDFEEVSRLGSLPCLRQVTLQGNPLARRSKYRVTVRLAPMASTPASSTATSTVNQSSLGGSTFGTPATVTSDTTFDVTALPSLPAAPRWTARRPAKPAQIEDMAPCSGSALAYTSALGASVLAEHEDYEEPLGQVPQLSGLDLQQQQQQQQLEHSTSADSESDMEVEAVLWSLRHRSSSGAKSPLPLPARPHKAASSGPALQHYYGSPAYAGLLVLDHLQLYFKEHVFGSHAGAPYLHTMYHGPPAATASAAADATQPEPESFIALFRDTIVPGAASGKAAHMREVLTRPALRRDANGAPRGNAAGEVPVLVVITSHRVHFVTEDGLADQMFAEAPRPTSLVSVLLRDLREAALGLALQKLRLVFEHVFDAAADTGGSRHHHHSESGTASPFTLQVTVLTRSRSRTHALITALEPAAADARARAGLPALAVTNEDAPVMEVLAPLTGGRESALALYQLVLQRWPLRPWVAAPRSLLATASELVLCDESHDSSASDLQPFVVDRGRLADVTSVELLSRRGGGCLQFSVKLRAQGVLQSKRQWVLQCRTSSDADRVVAELRRLSKAQRDGKGVVATALSDLLL